MGSWRAIDAGPPRPWKRPLRWSAASSGKGRHDAARLRADGDPGQDGSIQLDPLGLIRGPGLLSRLDVPVAHNALALAQAEDLVPASYQRGDQERADRADKEETQHGPPKAHQSELTPSGMSRPSGSRASATAASCAGERCLEKCSRIPRRWTGEAFLSRTLPAGVKIAKVPRRSEAQRPRLTRPPRTRRSTRRVRPLGLRRTRSDSSVMRRRPPGVKLSWTRTSYSASVMSSSLMRSASRRRRREAWASRKARQARSSAGFSFTAIWNRFWHQIVGLR